MADVVYEEVTDVFFCASIANIAAPTVAEITAGVRLTALVTKDGVNPGATNNRVPNEHLDTSYDGEVMGSHSGQLSLKFTRTDNPATDVARNTLGQRKTQGFFVVGWLGITPAAGERVDVYDGETGTPVPNATEKNASQMWTCEIASTNFAPDVAIV